MNRNHFSIVFLGCVIFGLYLQLKTETFLISKDSDSTIMVGIIVTIGGYLLKRLFDATDEIKAKQPPDNKYWDKVDSCFKAVDANYEALEVVSLEIKSITAELQYLEGLLSNGNVTQGQLLTFVQKINSKKQIFDDRRKNPRLRFLVTKFINMFEVLSKIHSKDKQLAITLAELKKGEASSEYFEEIKKVS